MPLKHGPIEVSHHRLTKRQHVRFSMPLKHGPIEVATSPEAPEPADSVFHAPKAWPH